MSVVIAVSLFLILAKAAAEVVLARLNRRHVLAHRGRVPEAFANAIDAGTYAKSVEYTLAKNNLAHFETLYESCILLLALFSGTLPWLFAWFSKTFGTSVWAMAAFLFSVGLLLSLPGLPVGWYAQFRLEERFGFNTTTPRLWWIDRIKGLLLAIIFGGPLLALVLKIADWAVPSWWI